VEKSPKELPEKPAYVGPPLVRHGKLAEVRATRSGRDTAYTLYRNGSADRTRIHVVTFDSGGDEEYNRKLCEYAQQMFQAQAPLGQEFWCERGHFRAHPARSSTPSR
jgi:hypothetical protein